MEDHLGVGTPLDAVEILLADLEHQVASQEVKVGDQAVVLEQPAAMTERMAVAPLHRGPGGGPDVRQEHSRSNVGGQVAEIVVVPGRSHIPEHTRGLEGVRIPADPKAVAIHGFLTHGGPLALHQQGMLGVDQSDAHRYDGACVRDPAAHRSILVQSRVAQEAI